MDLPCRTNGVLTTRAGVRLPRISTSTVPSAAAGRRARPMERSSVFSGGVATKNSELTKSLEVIKSELGRMVHEGPTQAELDNAKSYLIGSFALRFDTNHPVVKDYDDSALRRIDDTAGSTVTLQTTLTFGVAPGEQFYVWQKLAAWAVGGTRSADAYSTMTASFDQPELVRSLSVPEPALAVLLGAALLSLGSVRRRSRRG